MSRNPGEIYQSPLRSHIQPDEGFMQLAAGALQNRTTYEEPVQTDGSKMSAHAHVIKENRSARFGLPCANCKAYYASALPSCPICKCADRVPPRRRVQNRQTR